ncbi:hypothetical protein GRI97_15580 [Altererythrobacter xixiisoli]|uniref:Regulator of ribonuclease activity B domain-containing protein n=1 Tax=Croceibacterium xixiisoli TaxID=1476466 RepID=A0A6I4TZC2_9SPHN|nr:ribonuclease E inhibitor RraB [Croceibacterium xixiisoli]MXP00412.1 hypothetical protein [Croceibacterium xixiisoli]
MDNATDMSVGGENDRWMLLERQSDEGGFMVVRTRVNDDIHECARANRITAVICDIDARHVNDSGMPLCMDALYDLEDHLIAMVADRAEPGFHTASATGDGRRTIYFVHAPELDLAAVVAMVSSDVAVIACNSHFAFKTYDAFVTPTQLDTQVDGDRRVISSLNTHGDDGSIPRKIDFWFYGDRADLEGLAANLSASGLLIDHWLEDETGLVLTCDAPANFSTFAELTPMLLEAAAASGVRYDGWETLVIKEPESQSNPSFFKRLLVQGKAD